MAGSKTTDSLPSAGTLDGDEIVYVIDDPGGTPADERTTVDAIGDRLNTRDLYLKNDGDAGTGAYTFSSTASPSTFAQWLSNTGSAQVFIREIGTGEMFLSMNNTSGTGVVQIATVGDSYFNAGDVGIGTTSPDAKLEVNGDLKLDLTTEDLTIDDAGSASATEQDWIEVTVGGVTGYIRVFSSK